MKGNKIITVVRFHWILQNMKKLQSEHASNRNYWLQETLMARMSHYSKSEMHFSSLEKEGQEPGSGPAEGSILAITVVETPCPYWIGLKGKDVNKIGSYTLECYTLHTKHWVSEVHFGALHESEKIQSWSHLAPHFRGFHRPITTIMLRKLASILFSTNKLLFMST